MKCPYTDCKRDYNPEWGSVKETIFGTRHSSEGDGLVIHTSTCRFCFKQFHTIYRQLAKKHSKYDRTIYVVKELLFTFPSSSTKFQAKKIPTNVKDSFNEAERCRSVGSLSGVGACLRKTIYAVCDDKGVEGEDYRKKIGKLPVKGKYQDLLKQIKWLGDNTTKPGAEKYTMEEADLALEILPLLIDELYAKDEKIDKVEKILSKAKSKKTQ